VGLEHEDMNSMELREDDVDEGQLRTYKKTAPAPTALLPLDQF